MRGCVRKQIGSVVGWGRLADKRGAAAVELALIIPLLLIILFGMIELGWGLYVKAVVTNAAREGARFAVTPPATADEVKDRVSTYLGSFLPAEYVEEPQVNPSNLGPSPYTPPSGGEVEVTAIYSYAPLTGMLFLPSGWTWTITASVTMRRE